MTISANHRTDTSARPEAAACLQNMEARAEGNHRQPMLALQQDVNRADAVDYLNQILADTIVLRDMYKNYLWQVSGTALYPEQLFCFRHFTEQHELTSLLAKRVQRLGGSAAGTPREVAESSIIRHSNGADRSVQVLQLLRAHETILVVCHAMALEAFRLPANGTADAVAADVIRVNEMHVWLLFQHAAGNFGRRPHASASSGEGPPAE